eukprot:CAMPEP_0201718110 /NCGR_PEP_ID=MMETSP0593-20130828/3679_1 /ASSEMBLY_ACC=CAM_ASM_000672 /TAXON_ID=267983 /ORGANISM="Skeletonema japonicum, Strain CCMP2506" /LENGTH=307 /DNA_ID=CAMNT_0048208317 /DNA_START=65 /DNA_END=988 /DNA_ORIENTATION=-
MTLPRTIISSSNNLAISYAESCLQQNNSANTVEPVTLFIHGLDSSSHTWRRVQERISSPSFAIDCRGCGNSDLGNPDDFTSDALVADVKSVVDSHPLLQMKRFVLVGHSMGGRIAMCYAAKYPEDVSALVIEDMDIRRRKVESNFIPNFDETKALSFEKLHPNLDSLRKAFGEIGYPSDMVDKWVREGRVYEYGSEGQYWSDVHPAFRALCYRRIFDSNIGSTCWNTISQHYANSNTVKVHLLVAGIGSVCEQESINEMIECMPATLSVKTYPTGYHSLHGSVMEEFLCDLKEIIADANSSHLQGKL